MWRKNCENVLNSKFEKLLTIDSSSTLLKNIYYNLYLYQLYKTIGAMQLSNNNTKYWTRFFFTLSRLFPKNHEVSTEVAFHKHILSRDYVTSSSTRPTEAQAPCRGLVFPCFGVNTNLFAKTWSKPQINSKVTMQGTELPRDQVNKSVTNWQVHSGCCKQQGHRGMFVKDKCKEN